MIPIKYITQDILTTRGSRESFQQFQQQSAMDCTKYRPIANQYSFQHPEAPLSHETIAILSAYLFSRLSAHTLRRGARKRSAQDRAKHDQSSA
jgi:hypothetical protein